MLHDLIKPKLIKEDEELQELIQNLIIKNEEETNYKELKSNTKRCSARLDPAITTTTTSIK